MINLILTSLYSLLCVVLINFFIIIKKIINKKKVIFFYNPKENLTDIHEYYITNLFKEYYSYNFFFVTKKLSNKYYYIKETFLKLIFNVDIFITNNVSNNFTYKSIRVYMHHDIYDTPLVNISKEFELKKRLENYDYIFLPSSKSELLFKTLFLNVKKSPKIYIMGFYPKLNFLLQNNLRYDKKKLEKKIKIILAPTNFKSFPNLSIYPHLDKILVELLNNKNYQIIFRPHPSNIFEKKVKLIQSRFSKYNNFYYDDKPSYVETYRSSSLLITDLSGTAYTYALFMRQPVIFFSASESRINKIYYKSLNYFKDRKKVGFISKNSKQLNTAIKKSLQKKFKKKVIMSTKRIYEKNFSKANSNIFSKLRTTNKYFF